MRGERASLLEEAEAQDGEDGFHERVIEVKERHARKTRLAREVDLIHPPIMERYPPDAVTEEGKWYVMTSAEFHALCERFPDVEITSGPETVEATALPDGAPELTQSDAVYLFAPRPEPDENAPIP